MPPDIERYMLRQIEKADGYRKKRKSFAKPPAQIDVAQALRYGTCTLQPNGKYLCVCKTELMKASIKRHLASNKHLEEVRQIQYPNLSKILHSPFKLDSCLFN